MTEPNNSKIPLLLTPSSSSSSSSSLSGTSSSIQTLGNIIVSVVGTGVLGLPFAFKVAGWLAGSLGVIIAAICTYYCMLLLVECRDKLQTEEEGPITQQLQTYGDLGYKALGSTGRYLTEFLIVISQCGGSVAYIVFIGQNLSSISNLSSSSFVLILIPIEITLSWIRSLSALAPFSVFADICNVLAMSMVLTEDLQLFDDYSNIKAIASIGGLPFAGGVAVFCFEGFGMTLALEASMRKRSGFKKVLALAFAGITLMYVCFGFFGYLAYGDQTRDIITLNLPKDWSATAVKIGLCVGLTFTFPIMMHPIQEIIEAKLKEASWFQKLCFSNAGERFVVYMSRGVLVVSLALLALCVPGFGIFVSLVGSTVCALLSFVFPATFHLILMGSSLGIWRKALDYIILSSGLAFACYGTYNTAVSSKF
ncbi:hypothetical protein GIB67_025432 [Kingdonia uniflora]|uniref:Amino acid transporter transmembrane domain-containing protein n=1 Tax=Kingdonia uniflora TaxID=39325 RepID=A0A7J7N1A5_9MAGN|nr:hypothetical protein GIB67_025432 [Kingdonia uniflora]